MMELTDIITIILIIAFVICGVVFLNDELNIFVNYETCNEQGMNLEHIPWAVCIDRGEYGCSGENNQCEENRKEICQNETDSDKWFCNLDSQRRYYPKGDK